MVKASWEANFTRDGGKKPDPAVVLAYENRGMAAGLQEQVHEIP